MNHVVSYTNSFSHSLCHSSFMSFTGVNKDDQFTGRDILSQVKLARVIYSQDTFGLYFGGRKLYFAFLSMNNKFLVSIN